MFTRRQWATLAAGSIFAAVAFSPAPAQLPTYGVGRAPTEDETAAWDLTIPFDGVGLPAGSGTAANGRPIFAEKCASCHGERGESGKYDRLVGGHGSLPTDRPVLTVGSFWPHAPTLWSYIRRSQPIDQPGSLTADEAYALTAYLLHLADGVSPASQWHHRRTRRDGCPDSAAGQDAEPRGLRARSATRRGENGKARAPLVVTAVVTRRT